MIAGRNAPSACITTGGFQRQQTDHSRLGPILLKQARSCKVAAIADCLYHPTQNCRMLFEAEQNALSYGCEYPISARAKTPGNAADLHSVAILRRSCCRR